MVITLDQLKTSLQKTKNYIDETAKNAIELIANKFDNTISYNIGDYILYNGKLYKFTSPHAAGNFDDTEVEEVIIVDEMINDVTINGTSIVENGVAEIPAADADIYGVVKVGQGLFVQTSESTAKGQLTIYKAGENEIKVGTNGYKPIVPQRQHQSVFYGLAKAAGDSTQSASDNAVGTYTDEAKVAIQKMLGVYQPPWELLNDFTLTEESGFDLSVDDNGTPYNLLGVYILVSYPADTSSASVGYGRYRVHDSDGTYLNAETGKYTTSTNPKGKFIYLLRNGPMATLVYSTAVTIGNSLSWYNKFSTSQGVKFDVKNIVRINLNTDDVEPAGANIKIYGQRAY